MTLASTLPRRCRSCLRFLSSSSSSSCAPRFNSVADFHVDLLHRHRHPSKAHPLRFPSRRPIVSASSSSASLFPGSRPFFHSSPSASSVRHSQLNNFNGFFGSRRYSGGPDLFDATTVLWTLIGTNVAVYAMWQQMDFRFMDKHFMVSVDSVLSGRLYTILTSAFSQRDGSHLLSNMIGLYFFGSEIGRAFGGKYLLTIYLAGAVGGSLGHLLYYTYIYPWLQKTPRYFYSPRYSPAALGASGAVTSIMLLNIFLHPKQIIFFQMFIPMPAALLGVIIIGRDLWLAKQGDTDVSGPAHLGGALVAFLAFLKIKF